jgi:hypothetical protein
MDRLPQRVPNTNLRDETWPPRLRGAGISAHRQGRKEIWIQAASTRCWLSAAKSSKLLAGVLNCVAIRSDSLALIAGRKRCGMRQQLGHDLGFARIESSPRVHLRFFEAGGVPGLSNVHTNHPVRSRPLALHHDQVRVGWRYPGRGEHDMHLPPMMSLVIEHMGDREPSGPLNLRIR